jgi:hypothetical protein
MLAEMAITIPLRAAAVGVALEQLAPRRRRAAFVALVAQAYPVLSPDQRLHMLAEAVEVAAFLEVPAARAAAATAA